MTESIWRRHRQLMKERGDKISLLALAQADHGGVVGFAFGAAVPTEILVVPVAVFFAVGLVVLVVVADQIV